MTPKFHVMIVFASGKRKQQDNSTSRSQSQSATRTTSANGTSGRGLSTSQITSGVFADNFSELEDKYDNQLMSTMTAKDVYRWLRMRGMESIQGIPKRIYSTDHLEVSDLSTTKQESSVAPGNDLIMMKGGSEVTVVTGKNNVRLASSDILLLWTFRTDRRNGCDSRRKGGGGH
jgi:hypothetical protein